MATAVTTFGPPHFINRELSWLEFNQRVLDEALDTATPLLERVKFFCIASSNLDEFFEVRVAGLKQQIESDVVERSLDGLTASETFRAITQRVRRMVPLVNRHQTGRIQRAVDDVEIVFRQVQRAEQRGADLGRTILFQFEPDRRAFAAIVEFVLDRLEQIVGVFFVEV